MPFLASPLLSRSLARFIHFTLRAIVLDFSLNIFHISVSFPLALEADSYDEMGESERTNRKNIT